MHSDVLTGKQQVSLSIVTAVVCITLGAVSAAMVVSSAGRTSLVMSTARRVTR
jgi:hypothetical protein